MDKIPLALYNLDIETNAMGVKEMIREVQQAEYQLVYKLVKQDNARNYFIRLGFESGKPVYERIIGEWDRTGELKAVLLKRISGNLQFYAKGQFDAGSFAEHMKTMEFHSLISPKSYCDDFLDRGLFGEIKEGAYISKLPCNTAYEFTAQPEVETLRLEDLDEVIALYEKVFNSFSAKPVMEKRLSSGRGRGVCIRQDGKIVSVVQSEFEEIDSALIVGVASAPEIQGKGLATKCLQAMCKQLREEGKDLYLQYDNLAAGRIYERLGFRPIDRVKHYIKR